MRLRTLFGVIGLNLIWSAHPAMGKLALESYSPAHASLLRYAGALVAYLIAVPFIRKRFGEPFLVPKSRNGWLLVVLLGFLTFCFSPFLQMTGLDASRATDNSLIIAMEPLMTVLLARLVLGERMRPAHLACFGVALAGFALLTGLSPARLANGLDAHLAGNLVMLVSLIGEAAYSSLGSRLMRKHPPTAVFGTALAVGVACLVVLSLALGTGLPSFANASWRSTLGLLWLGPLGTGFAYLAWMIVLSRTTVAALALTLFVQPVMGSVWGVAFLGDKLTLVQAAGGSLILLAVFSGEWLQSNSRKAQQLHPR